ncbi:helix-turn-helix transcriptional regulator [Singulisphaera sp. Ch08]|uniref:Helix-turn-helix transcriptional regulator n=1 Tax=Singulisphaera sp. Ch08 TaxID=3120278 RepID=A0AAU7CD34_9BACT
MARRKTLPDLVKTKYSLAERLGRLRAELFGDRGGPELARRLGIPVRTWYNYEAGVTVPAEVVLRIIELTAVEPMWLLHGKGPKFRPKPIEDFDSLPHSERSVGSLLRTALQILEQGERSKRSGTSRGQDELDDDCDEEDDLVLLESTDSGFEPVTRASGTKFLKAQAGWLEAEEDGRQMINKGDAMCPIVADGASVVFASSEEDPATLDGKLVVAWVDGTPQLRWFEVCGDYARLRAEASDAESYRFSFDIEGESEDDRVRRVLWIRTPH